MSNTLSIEEMRTKVAESDRAASDAGLEQLEAMLASKPWTTVKTELAKAKEAYAHDPLATLQLDSLTVVIKGVEALPEQIRGRVY